MIHNPILTGLHPDPTLCRVGEDFYLAVSSFAYFPGVPLYQSRDLVHWKLLGHCLTRRSQIDLDGTSLSQGIYAPTLRFHAGRFSLVTTSFGGIGNFLVSADNPSGPWSDPVPIAMPGIDPSLLFHDGKAYFAVAANLNGLRGAYLSEIDCETGQVLTEPRYLWGGSGGRYPEAPHLYSKDGWIYLLMAEGGTEFGHMVTIARSRDIYGPYEPCPSNPILSHRSTWSALQSTGHGDLFQDAEGRWWMVFLAARHHGYPPAHHLGRETCLTPVTWPEGEWPSINGGKPLPDDIPLPDGWTNAPVEPEPMRDDFEASALGMHWNFRRNPVAGSWSLTRRPGYLSLKPLSATLEDVAPMAFLGRRQQHFDCTAAICLEFSPSAPNEEAGLAAAMSERYYAALVVTRRVGKRVVLVRRRFGSLRVDSDPVVLPEGAVELRFVAQTEEYSLQVHLPDGWRVLETVETRQLSTEIAGGFTGIYFALFATANGRDSDCWAEFDWFDYQPY